MKNLLLILVAMLIVSNSFAQNSGSFVPYSNEFYQRIKESLTNEQSANEQPVFKAEPPKNYPKSVNEFTASWCQNPVSQGNTGTCWCFSTSSFLESEVKRTKGIDIKLSEMYIVFHEYIEKARGFVATRGNTYLGEGSETNAVTRLIDTYGLVPYSAYAGKPNNQEFYDHSGFFETFEAYLTHIKETNAWNEEVVLGTVANILTQYFGAPPLEFTYREKPTPLKVLGIKY